MKDPARKLKRGCNGGEEQWKTGDEEGTGRKRSSYARASKVQLEESRCEETNGISSRSLNTWGQLCRHQVVLREKYQIECGQYGGG